MPTHSLDDVDIDLDVAYCVGIMAPWSASSDVIKLYTANCQKKYRS